MNKKFNIANEAKFIEKTTNDNEISKLHNYANAIIDLKGLLILFESNQITHLSLSSSVDLGRRDIDFDMDTFSPCEISGDSDSTEYTFEREWYSPSEKIKQAIIKCLEIDIREKEKEYFVLKDRYLKEKSEAK